MEVDFRDKAHKNLQDDEINLRPKMAINSESEESDSDEDPELKAAKKAIYAKNYMRKTNANDSEFDSESDYWARLPPSILFDLTITYLYLI